MLGLVNARAVRALVVVALVGCSTPDDGSGAASAGGAAGSAGTGGSAGAPADLAKEKLWAEQVALGTEFGGSGQVIARWTKSPTLSVMQGTEAERADLYDLVPRLNELLAPISIDVVADADPGANIQVHFTSLAEFDGIGAANGFPVVAGNWGYFYMFWNGEHALTRTFVLIATDQLEGAQLRHFTFEETTQSLGLASDSSLFADSIFYASGSDGGDATELSPLDEKLVSFVYGALAPGDGKAELDAAFDASW